MRHKLSWRHVEVSALLIADLVVVLINKRNERVDRYLATLGLHDTCQNSVDWRFNFLHSFIRLS